MSGVRYHVEYIIPELHGGTDDLDNVALACPMCNCYIYP
ncbi:MAG: HNH endonuclease [Verrucomicrobia bacterium]|nr:HNH endonuclease [Verrucomicrobiota bacterium]